MIGVFVSLDLFLFYVFWDAMLIPMYFLIGIWGYERRIYAAVKFILYTMAGSVLMLLAILGLAYLHSTATGSYSFDLLKLYELQMPPHLQFWFFLAFALAFAIKVPLFPFHTWLPDAHVEAPTAGSVHSGRRAAEDGHLRARALRVSAVSGWPPRSSRRTWPRSPSIGIIYGALVAMVQPDMKKLVAYSSVSHLGLRRARHRGDEHAGRAGRRLPDAQPRRQHRRPLPHRRHAVGSPAHAAHRRVRRPEEGRCRTWSPSFLIVTLSSIGLPGLNGFVGEFLILLGAFRWDPRMAAFAATGVILSATYMLWMFQRVNYGPVTNEKNASAAGPRGRASGS